MDKTLNMLVMGMSAVLIGCVEDAGPGCRDQEVTVNHEAAYLSARPEHVMDICPGNTLTLKLMPPLEAGAARSAPARENPDDAAWLSGSNRERDRIVLTVADGAEGTYKYSITVDGIGMLDPRVTVARR